LNITRILPLQGRVDTNPSLTALTLRGVTSHIVDCCCTLPTSMKNFNHFSSIWLAFLTRNHSPAIPASTCPQNIWALAIPPGLKEILWKWTLDALPISHRFHGDSNLGRTCRYGSELTLPHMWKSCIAYNISDLLSHTDLVIQLHTAPTSPPSCHTDGLIMARDNNPLYWLPILSIKQMETLAYPDHTNINLLSQSRKARCTDLGCLLWHIWKNRMREIFDPPYRFIPSNTLPSLSAALQGPLKYL
jgi:hypothetical protein